jgi:guanylate kinase
MSIILTLTGMSTSGKSTLAKALTSTGVYSEAVSVTTRQMRPGEVNGQDYHFVSQDTFDDYVRKGMMLEHVTSHHASYGVPSFEVERIRSAGKSVVMVLEPEGVSSIHRIALSNNDSFISAFVHVDIKTLLERFFIRINAAITSGKIPDYSQEAKRLHVMLSQERAWVGRWDWDLTMMHLHKDNNLESSVDSLIKYHYSASLFKPVARELRPALDIECLSVTELAESVKSQIEMPKPIKEFHCTVISPLVEKQRKVRYREGMPELAL